MKTIQFLFRRILFCFVIFYSLVSNAQQTTMGTDFWLGFMDFFDNTVTVDVRISSTVAASGTVAVPGQAWSTPFNVAANSTTIVNIPIGTVYVGTSETVSPRGIHITSNNTVSVIATTNTAVRSETALVLTTPVLSTQYYVASYDPGNFNFTSEFLVVATTNGTTVDITPATQTAGGKAAGATFSVNLNAGDVYQVKAGSNGTKDLTGTKVAVSPNTPCKSIAVFSGMNDGYVPASTCGTADPLFEEMNPVSVWGTDYVVAPYFSSTGCQVRIIASQTTSVSVDGGPPFTLNAGQFNEQSFNGSAHCIIGNKPIEVVQYMKGNECSGATPNKGDPSMMILNSNAQLIPQVVFSPFNTNMAARYVNVVMQTANVGQLTLDGTAVGAGAFSAVPCSGYSYAKINITNAFHTLAAASGFVSYLYGYGTGDDGFSNPLGWSINLPSALTPTITGTTSICTGGSTTLNAGGPYNSYSWSPGGQTTSAITISPASTSTYTVSVTGACGNGSGTVQVTVNPPPTPTITGTTTVCSGNSTTLTAGGGTTYLWNTGATTTSITVNPVSNTTYTVTATSNGCTGMTTVTVTIAPGPTPTISGTTTVCPGVSTTLTASGGGTYSWSTGATTTTITVTPVSTTTYTLTTNSGGCTGTATVQVTVGGGISPTITGTTNICPGASTTLTANSGGTYAWSTGASTTAITVSPAVNTTYSVTATSGGCTGTATVQVSIITPPAPTITGTTTICNGTSTTLTANGGVTYSWNTGATTTAITVSPTTNTSYSVTATNAGGCTGTVTIAVTVNPNPAPTISGTTTICAGTSTTLTATGGGSYSWSTGDLTASTTVSPATTTTYTVTVTNAGCTGSAAVQVTVSANLAPVITGNTTICNGTITTLTTSGGGTYAWSDGTTNPSITVSPTTNTSYSVTVTNGSCSGTASVQVTVNQNPTPTITGNTSICPGTSTTLTANGGTTYVWDNGSTTTSIAVSPISATTYTVTATTSGCTGQTNVTVSITLPPSASISGTTTICTGTSTTLTASGGGTYVWNTGASTAAITVSPTTTTTYTVTVTTGCTATATVQVTVQPTLTPTITGTTTICNGTSTTLTTSGGGTYTWSDGTNNPSITVSPTTTTIYSVTVTNGLCSGTASQQVTVNQNPTPTITGTSTICSGQSTTLTASGGMMYVWNNGATTTSITISPVSTITYTVTASSNGCTGTATAQVIVNPTPTPTITGTTSICNGQSTTLTSSTAGPYNWSNGATTPTITVTPTATTTYSVSVTQNGCTGTNNITVTVVPPIIASINGDSICAGQSATLTASGGTTYVWSTSETTNPITVSPSGTTTYTVIVSTGSCADTATYTVKVNPLPTASATGTTTISYGNSTQLNATGGGTYSWSPPTGLSCTDCPNPIASPTANTQYCVTVTTGGCADSSCIFITIDTKCGDNGELFVPNGFSPNADGQNDVLYVRGGGMTGMYWVIYDRWGEKVFETTDPKQGWDGTYNGKQLDPAVFVYYLKVTCFSGDEISQKGNVAIIK